MTDQAACLDPAQAPGTVVRWGQGSHLFELHAYDPEILSRALVVFRPWMTPHADANAAMSWRIRSAASGTEWRIRSTAGDEMPIRGGVALAVTTLEFLGVRALLEGPVDALTFHAALVAREDRGLLILGPNEAGKSTLACDLWRSGFSLLGDDVAIVEPATSEALSAPRRVSLRSSSRELLGDGLWARVLQAPSSEATSDGRVFHPDEVDGCPRPRAVRLAACVFLARRETATPPGVTRRLPPAQALLALLPYSNLIRRLEAGIVIDRIAPVAAAVPAFDLGRATLDEMRRAINGLLDGAA